MKKSIDQVDELVNIIDRFMENGGHQLNIKTDDDQTGIKLSISKTNECVDGPCKIPTMDKDRDK